MYCFIVNPVAGHGRCLRLMELLTQKLLHQNVEYEVVYTDKAGHAQALAGEAAHRGCSAVVVVGGDGTVKEAAAGLVEAGGSVPLGIIPGGTGNDYRRVLGIPLDCLEALDVILQGTRRTVDAATFNGKLFLNIGSAGFDAAVVRTTSRLKWLGALSYYAAVFLTLVGYRARRVRLWVDDVLVQERDMLLMAAGNGCYYGGGMKALPQSQPDDGILEVCVADGVPPWKIAALFPQFTVGGHGRFSFVHFHRCTSVRVESLKGTFAVQTDGEVYEDVTDALFRVLPRALQVLAPSAANTPM